MATFSRVLLSGSAVGGWEDLPTDNTFKTVHQSSTTSGVIEDISLEVTNFGSSAATITVRMEQDGTLKHTFSRSVAAGATEDLLDQIAIAHNVDIKLRWDTGVTGAALSGDGGVMAKASGWKTVPLDMSGSGTTAASPYGDRTPWAVDQSNGYLFGLSSGYLQIIDLKTGAELFNGSGFPNTSIYQISINETAKKGVIHSAITLEWFDYSDPTAVTRQLCHTDAGASARPGCAMETGYAVWWSGGQIRFYNWDAPNSLVSSPSISQYTAASSGRMISDPLGDYWALFGIGDPSYAIYSGAFGDTGAATAVYDYYIGAGAFKRGSDEFWLVGQSSDGFMHKCNAGTTNNTTYAQDSGFGCNQNYWNGAVYGLDETGDECIFYFRQTNNYVAKYNITDDTFTAASSLPSVNSTHGFLRIPTGDEMGFTAPSFAGFANRMTP